jgi:tetratricopeptide (TPR) repeat protein
MALYDGKDSTSAAEFARQAIQASNEALLISPSNVNFWKSRTRVFYILAQIDPQYLTDALNALLQAEKLAPTDPKIRYNLALLYEKQKNMDSTYRELDAAARLKPDYRDVYLAQALFYSKDKKLKEAQTAVEYILNRIDPNDADAKQILKDLK